MAELGFDGKVAIVTGAGGGLGRQHALMLASRGAQVVVNDLGGSVSGEGADVGPAEAVAEEIRKAGGEAVSDGNSVSTQQGGEAIAIYGMIINCHHTDRGHPPATWSADVGTAAVRPHLPILGPPGAPWQYAVRLILVPPHIPSSCAAYLMVHTARSPG